MKQILIIDNQGRAQSPNLESFAMVDFRETVKQPQEIDPEEYATVFVHRNNSEEMVWAKEHFSPVFIFSGGTARPNKVRHIVNLSREKYREHLVEFLNKYEETGKLDPEIFFSGGD